MTTVLAALEHALLNSGSYNPDIEVAPAAVLWPDKDRLWQPIIGQLQARLPQLWTLGDYVPEQKTGPAIWLRCAMANRVDGIGAAGAIPILYLPGVSRQELRAIESCPESLKPLVELQYRGVIWSQVNAKDWTILAFLRSDQGGLGLEVAQDRAALHAMQLALYRLLDVDVSLLKGKRLDKDYFNTLLIDGDPIRDLLQWLDQGDAFKAAKGDTAWPAFVEVIKSQLGFDPDKQGTLSAAALLAAHEGPWQPVWDRYCEAPKLYPNIPAQLEKTVLPMDMFADKSGWPQWNRQQENELRLSLARLEQASPAQARKSIADLDNTHGERRTLVWAELGLSPLAQSLKWLKKLTEVTKSSIAGGTIADMANTYQAVAWQADDAVVQALKPIDQQEDFDAASKAIRAMYTDWAQDAARYLQESVQKHGYPGLIAANRKPVKYAKSETVFFVDGLRFDVGKRFAESLEAKGYSVELSTAWSALPSVTATAKPAVSPVAQLISGVVGSEAFEPCVKETEQKLSGHHFQKLLETNGWQKLAKTDVGESTGQAWCEYGDIDSQGHDRGWKLAKHIDAILVEVEDRISSLLNAGWKQVRLVTDHGWLLLPGGLPKTELPAALVDSKWGRCASIKPGSHTDEQLYPWHWNADQYFALANGISCYKLGEEYTHGGLSLQECLTPELTIRKADNAYPDIKVEITDVSWRGLRCNVGVEGAFEGLLLDVRLDAGDATTSEVMSTKAIKDSGIGSVVIEDEDLEGLEGFILVLTESGEPVAQQRTRIGGE